MTSVASILIKNNNKADIFRTRIVGIDGVVFIKQSASECRTGRVSIYSKMGHEKAYRIGVYEDNRSMDDLKEYIKEELIEKKFIIEE